MDFDEFETWGKRLVEYIANYFRTIRDHRVYPDVEPGYMRSLLPESAPEDGEPFDDIFRDFQKVIIPGITHWQSPYMHAYFPALTSPASVLGEMLSSAINCLGFTWASSPAFTELEIIVTDWLGKMIGLPKDFLHGFPNSRGGGVIQTTASEATLVAMLAARTKMITNLKETSDVSDDMFPRCLVAYASDQAHSSVEKAAMISLVQVRFLKSDDKFQFRGDQLKKAIQTDRRNGLIPFYVCATLGTTGCCAFDNLTELGNICNEQDIWMHVDAAYAGTALICPEFRHLAAGVELADSFAMNPSKWMMVNFDCTTMWVKDCTYLHKTFNVDPLYLHHAQKGVAVDFMHWQIPLSRKFRALKLWFVIRNYGIKGLQKHIRKGVSLAKTFEELVAVHPRFEVAAERKLGLVVFCVKDNNFLTEQLLKKINSTGKIYFVPALLKKKIVIRYAVTSFHTTIEDIHRDWSIILREFHDMLLKLRLPRAFSLSVLDNQCGISALLYHSPLVPRIIDGSYITNKRASKKSQKIYSLQSSSGSKPEEEMSNVSKQISCSTTYANIKLSNRPDTISSRIAKQVSNILAEIQRNLQLRVEPINSEESKEDSDEIE